MTMAKFSLLLFGLVSPLLAEAATSTGSLSSPVTAPSSSSLLSSLSTPMLSASDVNTTTVVPTLVVTATTGTPPPVVTFTPVRDTNKGTIISPTSSGGTLFFPLGWYWAPIVPPPGAPPLPPTLPPIPSTATPPEAEQPTTIITTDGCSKTTTPTVTVVISYSGGDGNWQTITETHEPNDVTGSCHAEPTTTSTTVPPPSATHYDFTGSFDNSPRPTDYPPVDQAVLQYLDSAFQSIDGVPPAPPAPTDNVVCNLDTVDDIGSENKPKDYPGSAYQAGAHQFCFGGYGFVSKPNDRFSGNNYFWFDTNHIDPATNLPAYCAGSARGTPDQWSPSSQKYCKGGKGLKNANSKVWYEVVPSADQSGCQPLQNYKLPEGQDCVDRWNKVINECKLPMSIRAGHRPL
ncbi:hypothetical protein F5Y04DRAFT_221027 [Hypomontagnella monticulosa]|nr:hypothetical protein F5Y04DRAFT_221027 [Hypomontagnella monticulosa]